MQCNRIKKVIDWMVDAPGQFRTTQSDAQNKEEENIQTQIYKNTNVKYNNKVKYLLKEIIIFNIDCVKFLNKKKHKLNVAQIPNIFLDKRG